MNRKKLKLKISLTAALYQDKPVPKLELWPTTFTKQLFDVTDIFRAEDNI